MKLMKKAARARLIWNLHRASYPLRSAVAGARSALGGPPLRPILLISDAAVYTSEQQFAPIARHAALLRRRLGVVVQQRGLGDAMTMQPSELTRFQLVGLKLGFRTASGEAERVVRHFAAALSGSATRLIYFDGDDDVNVQWHGVIAAVDLYVKKHVFADPLTYTKRFIGKSNLTDHAARHHGVSFADDIIPDSGGLPASALPKIHLGWNIALDDVLVELAQDVDAMPHPPRDIDLSSRGYVKPEVWTHPFRNGALERMEALGGRFKVLAPRDRVPKDIYYQEMLRSRICVSPFGFGEICWRDFEAILCGCLLVKPDMGHVSSLPDLFVPGVTYAPVRWDYSDLEQVCAEYLGDEAKRSRLVAEARRRLLACLEPGWFVDRFGELLSRLDGEALPSPVAMPGAAC
jgi:Glycosyl transferases group 1